MNGCHLSLISSSNNTFVGCAALTLNHTVHTIITSGRGRKNLSRRPTTCNSQSEISGRSDSLSLGKKKCEQTNVKTVAKPPQQLNIILTLI